MSIFTHKRAPSPHDSPKMGLRRSAIKLLSHSHETLIAVPMDSYRSAIDTQPQHEKTATARDFSSIDSLKTP